MVFVPSVLLIAQVGASEIDFSKYQEIRYVSESTGSDSGADGTREHPWASVSRTLDRIKDATEGNVYAVLVAAGRYSWGTIYMKPWVHLYGGFDREDWERDPAANETLLDGSKRHRVIHGASQVVLDGFVITQGEGGWGAGISFYLCSESTISNCTSTLR